MTAEEELIGHLGGYVTENKRDKIAEVLEQRTRHVTLALENVYQPHNASACLRTCECLGVQDVHVIEGRHDYRPNEAVTRGGGKWLTLHRYQKTASAIETLRTRGYRVVAVTPHEDGDTPDTLPLEKPTALVFGTEWAGISDTALASCDGTLRVPMFGMTESFNVSVTVALVLQRLVERLRSEGVAWQLAEAEKRTLTLEFYRRIVKRHDLLEEEFWKSERSE